MASKVKTPEQKAKRKASRLLRLQKKSVEAMSIPIVPKYTVGTNVNTIPNLYNETSGKITLIERFYVPVNEFGQRVEGCCSTESQFYIPKDKSLHDKPWQSKGNDDITYEFSGPNMIIGRYHGNKSNFLQPMWRMLCIRFSYVVSTPKMNTIFSENSILSKI